MSDSFLGFATRIPVTYLKFIQLQKILRHRVCYSDTSDDGCRFAANDGGNHFGLQVNDIEPFCPDELVLYRQCAEKRDVELRKRHKKVNINLGCQCPIKDANERASQLESQITMLDRPLILASGMEGVDGFRQRWSLHGRLSDTKMRLESLKQGLNNRKKDE